MNAVAGTCSCVPWCAASAVKAKDGFGSTDLREWKDDAFLIYLSRQRQLIWIFAAGRLDRSGGDALCFASAV